MDEPSLTRSRAEALLKALLEASGAEVLDALARIEWAKAHGETECPLKRIPTPEALAEWLPDCPESAWAAAHDLSGGWHGSLLGSPLSNSSPSDDPCNQDKPRTYTRFEVMLAQGGPGTGIQPAGLVASLATLHRRWAVLPPSERGRHPLGPLVRAWLAQPEHIKPDSHRQGILPFGLLPKQPHHAGTPVQPGATIRVRERNQPLPVPGAVIEPDAQGILPFAVAGEPSTIQRPTPLLLADASGISALKPGRGARLDKRLLVYSLLAMPLSQRRPGGRYELRRTVRELTGELWTRASYRPGKHGAKLLLALNAMHFAKVRLHDGSHWLPAVMRREPNPHDLDSEAVIQIELPSDCERGPRIDRLQLAAEGRRSDPAFDLWLGLAYLWDQAKADNGGHRIYATRPRARRDRDGCLLDTHGRRVVRKDNSPVRDWRHRRAVLEGEERHPHAGKVSWLDPTQVRRLAYGGPDRGKSAAQRRNELASVRRMLREHECEGRIVIEADGPNWRILETWSRQAS